MTVEYFERIVKTENSAKRFFVGRCWKNGQRFCPRCLTSEIPV
ncbi:MAG: transposase [Deltaproteobacteria bacterium]|nr:transposase [Deltaproteobacteria bacterium]